MQQQGHKGKKRQAAMRGAVKAAVLKGDSKSEDLIMALCYSQKPFYMILHCIKEITWVKVVKKVKLDVWHEGRLQVPALGFVASLQFEMNGNSIANQLRLVYWMMRFQLNFKWWVGLAAMGL